MKKILAVLLSVNLLVLNASPVLAQVAPRKLAQGAAKALTTPKFKLPAGVKIPAARPHLGAQVEKAALAGMRLPLTQNYGALLQNANPLLPAARQMLAHNNAKERALLLRSDFVALALNNQASAKDIQAATDFYRENLQKFTPNQDTAAVVADIASLGLLGSKQDAPLILKVAQASYGHAAQAPVTTVAARALLRLQAYAELKSLSLFSAVQPTLWEGIRTYAQNNQLTFQVHNPVQADVDVTPFQEALSAYGPLNQIAVDPSVEATYLYMNAGRNLPLPATPVIAKKAAAQPAHIAPAQETRPAEETGIAQNEAALHGQNQPEQFVVAPTQTAALAMAEQSAADVAQAQAKFAANHADLLAQAKAWLKRLQPKGLTSADETKFAQRAALYLTAFSIGLEIGTPIMASIRTALNLPLSLAVLVTVATYSPYLFGSFLANALKNKIGRKGTVNAGLALMGGSFALGATSLGLDGSFTAWNDQIAQFLGILGALTTASTGAVFIHSAVGPVMTEISHKASELVRQKRGTYVELSRSIGMIASFAFPFIATSMLGLDWSAPFILALPVVGASALALNLAKLPNTKPTTKLNAELKTVQSPVMEGVRKPRKSMTWKENLLNNSYVRLLREEPGVGSFISALFIMNAVEMGINSGFLFMIPQLTSNESIKYLLGMGQFAVPFLVGRYMAGHFLKWFPKSNLSVATLLGGVSALAALGLTDNMYAFTAALAMSELGISTAFTLAFARTAINPKTQDRVTSLIMATAVACAVGPMMLTWVAESLMGTGMTEAGATLAALIGIPSALAFLSAKLFRRMEHKTIPGLKTSVNRTLVKAKKLFKRK